VTNIVVMQINNAGIAKVEVDWEFVQKNNVDLETILVVSLSLSLSLSLSIYLYIYMYIYKI
jgi:hypothetical protein